MVPIILFISVAAIGVLGLVAMFLVAKQQVAAWLAERARDAARAARLIETARLKAEHAEVLAKLQPKSAAVVIPVPMPKAADTVSLTGVFQTLEQSGGFKRASAPVIEAAPRTRMAKGSVPMPLRDSRPSVPGLTVLPVPALPVANARTAPLTAVVTSRPASPPPLPRRSSRSIPPPVPGTRRVASGQR